MPVRIPALVLALTGLLIGVLAHLAPAAPASGALGVSVTYKAGWNLVGGPDGTAFGVPGNSYTFAAGDTAYESAPASAPVTAGKGYWMFFPSDTAVTLNGAGVGTLRQSLPAGQFVMVGNPSGVQAVTLSGADEVLAYDPVNGYSEVTQLAVGQGAWALSSEGGTLTMTATGAPLPIPTATPTPSPTPPPVAVGPTSPAGPSSPSSGRGECRGTVSVIPNFFRNVPQTLSISVSGVEPNQALIVFILFTEEGGGHTDSQGNYSGTISFTPITLGLPGVPGIIVGMLPVIAVTPNSCAVGGVSIQP